MDGWSVLSIVKFSQNRYQSDFAQRKKEWDVCNLSFSNKYSGKFRPVSYTHFLIFINMYYLHALFWYNGIFILLRSIS